MSAATVSLKQQAVLAAKQGDWQKAITLNQAILEKEIDINAYNRLGVAYLQTGDIAEARISFEHALSIDPNNPLTKKNLEKIAKKNKTIIPQFTKQQYIEEPGKTKIVELLRLANNEILDSLINGLQCTLKCKKRFISIEESGRYIGALPEDISFRISKLMNSGNIYNCYIRSVNRTYCSVFIKEIHRSPSNQDIVSFPINRSTLLANQEINEEHIFSSNPIDDSLFDSDKIDNEEDLVDETDDDSQPPE